MISAQNLTLPHLGADIRPAQPDPNVGPEPLTVASILGAVELSRAAKYVMLDDGRWALVVIDHRREGNGVIETPCAGAPPLKQSARRAP